LAKFHAGSWNGLAVPAKTPRDVVLRLSREIQAVMEMPEVKKRLSEVNLYAQGSTPEQAADILAQDVRRWGDVITKAKIDKQ
jgi:tripartite-type tricarboxylate transporter receptor subunit TctC